MNVEPAQFPELTTEITDWYLANARQLPWRGPDVSPWAVMVSEFMLQQTPVSRVIPAFERWMSRWPTPGDLAGEPSGEAVRMWGKLGYPRRALRLHAAAGAITEQYGGVVPDNLTELQSLPGVGDYTAAAICAFAFSQRAAVVDTNVRRVLHRAVLGTADAGASTTKADMALCDSVLPADDVSAALLSIALMEFGALVCTASNPGCERCPVRSQCAWVAAGSPAYDGPAKRTQRFTGTDRQVRGKLMDVLRASESPVAKDRLDIVWPDAQQRERALAALIIDGLATRSDDGLYSLPS